VRNRNAHLQTFVLNAPRIVIALEYLIHVIANINDFQVKIMSVYAVPALNASFRANRNNVQNVSQQLIALLTYFAQLRISASNALRKAIANSFRLLNARIMFVKKSAVRTLIVWTQQILVNDFFYLFIISKGSNGKCYCGSGNPCKIACSKG
jgi:hypothetical protein